MFRKWEDRFHRLGMNTLKDQVQVGLGIGLVAQQVSHRYDSVGKDACRFFNA